MAVPISVAILTKNEEHNLPGCLASIDWCDDIHVIDSGSSDRTVEIANAHPTKLAYHPFESFGKQRNWVLDNCEFKYEWLLFLDADEQSTPSFCQAIAEAVNQADQDLAGFYCCWKTMLDGCWLKRSDRFPKWQFRLLRLGKARFTDYGHGQIETELQGRVAQIAEPYLHYSFSKGWSDWLAKHNKYSDQEALEHSQDKVDWQKILFTKGVSRKKALKPLFRSTPGWPLFYFLGNYIFNLGFLEGKPGLIFCLNLAYYEFLIAIKMDELDQKKLAQKTDETQEQIKPEFASPDAASSNLNSTNTDVASLAKDRSAASGHQSPPKSELKSELKSD
jgi:glycosyltransferase involved in cell wall biosynthesis